jgi:hypothetical protein
VAEYENRGRRVCKEMCQMPIKQNIKTAKVGPYGNYDYMQIHF